jgi:hypothetical protein
MRIDIQAHLVPIEHGCPKERTLSAVKKKNELVGDCIRMSDELGQEPL